MRGLIPVGRWGGERARGVAAGSEGATSAAAAAHAANRLVPASIPREKGSPAAATKNLGRQPCGRLAVHPAHPSRVSPRASSTARLWCTTRPSASSSPSAACTGPARRPFFSSRRRRAAWLAAQTCTLAAPMHGWQGTPLTQLRSHQRLLLTCALALASSYESSAGPTCSARFRATRSMCLARCFAYSPIPWSYGK